MCRITCVILLAGFIASTTCLRVSPKDSDSSKAVAKEDTKELGHEAVLLGQILCKCAEDLKDEFSSLELLEDEVEEYFFRKFWNKTKQAFKNAVKSLKDKNSFWGNLWYRIKSIIKKVAKEVVAKIEAAVKKFLTKKTDELEEFLGKNAEKVIDGLLNKTLGSYSLEGPESQEAFMMTLCDDIDQMGRTLIEKGTELTE